MHYCKANLLITSSGKIIDENSAFQLGSTTARKTFETHAGTEFILERCLIAFYTGARKSSHGFWSFKKSTIIADESSSVQLYMMGAQDHTDSVFHVEKWYCRDGDCSFDNVKMYCNFLYYYTTGTINNFYVDAPVSAHVDSPTMKNTTIVGGFSLNHAAIHATMINTTIGGALSFVSDANYMLEKWEYNILVTDKDGVPQSGATVELHNVNGDLEWSGNSGVDGKTAIIEVLVARYDGTSEVKTDYNNFTLSVSKPGLAAYEAEVTIDHIIKDDQIVLGELSTSGIDVSVGNLGIVVTVEEPTIVVEVDCG